MDRSDRTDDNSRRRFLKGIAAMPVMVLAGRSAFLRGDDNSEPRNDSESNSFVPAAAPDKKLVAIQIGARSFVDEGVEKCLDTLHEKGGVNTVMATVFTYGTGLAGRQTRGQPLPDHGGQEYDTIHGGSYTK